jgi:hypothetical protein
MVLRIASNFIPSLGQEMFSFPSWTDSIPSPDRFVPSLKSDSLEPLFNPFSRFSGLWRFLPDRPVKPQTAVPLFPIFVGISVLLHGLVALLGTQGSEGIERQEICKDQLQKLTGEAQDVLKLWKYDHKSPAELGQFILDVDGAPHCTEDNGEKELQLGKQWRSELEKWRHSLPKTGDAETQIDALIDKLYDEHFLNYARDFPGLTDFLEEDQDAGNCVAQTKLILGALAASGIKLSPQQVLGIQIYEDHLQPVIYDYEKQELWVLTTGLRTKRIEGPVYHTALFYHAFLKAQGADSPVTEDELLILEATHPRRLKPAMPELASGVLERVFRNQGFAFPKTGVYFEDGHVPERAVLARPFKHYDPASGTASDTFKNRKPPSVLAWEDISNPRWKELYQFQAKYFSWFKSSNPTIDIFQNYKDKERFLQAGQKKEGKVEQEKILVSLLSESLGKIEKTDVFREALKLSSNPHQVLREKQSGELQRLFKDIEFIQGTYEDLMRDLIVSETGRRGATDKNWWSILGEVDDETIPVVETSHPLWHQLQGNLKALREWTQEHPKETWLFLDQLPREKKQIAYKWLVKDTTGNLARYFYEHVRMSDDPATSRPYDASVEPTFGVSLDPDSWIDIEVATDLDGFQSSPPVFSSEPAPASLSTPKDIVISYETGLLLSIANGFPPLPRQWPILTRGFRRRLWDRSISERVRQLNRNGELDFPLAQNVFWHAACLYDQTCIQKKYPFAARPTHSLPLLEDIQKRHPDMFSSLPPQEEIGGPLEENAP